ncbi:sulfhydryl oxidase [Aureococcus anophagefferens]|nr:sulfhydryl oxidase [Aureococcus anophagefferens]KAH8070173.1 sulfhydryl oxidase [Aureococcus anophagefferens]|mmetsp:Transcript_25579/g.84761  ORF Transcript_25579/g.84761 Transcript_25579/m.84761 type:complete len:169 (-) Transcript_25579:93-599(-)
MAPGFNADDCANPVCGDKMSMFSKSLARAKSTAAAAPAPAPACPVDRAELGRSTWDLLHTTAAYYPESPTERDRAAAAGLVAGLAALYPCEHCAADFREAVEASPPDLASRALFSIWTCEQHNLVNAKLGKKTFDCALSALDERWKHGAPGCWADADDTAAASLGRES